MSTLNQVIFFSLVGGLFSLIGGVLLISKKSTAKGLAKYATPFAAGALLAAAFNDLLKEGIHETGASKAGDVLMSALAGILAFFILERFLRWFHHHHEHGKAEKLASSSRIIIGDTLHNALDGVAIAAAFLINPATGIVTTIAVAAHEIPQEIGDFGLLLRNGVRRRNVLLINAVSALATTVAAIATFQLGEANALPIPLLLGLTAGFFIYIASSDIIPEVHENSPNGLLDVRPILLLLGAGFVLAVNPIAHQYIDAGHSHDHGHEHSHHDDHDEHHHEELDHHEEHHDDNHHDHHNDHHDDHEHHHDEDDDHHHHE